MKKAVILLTGCINPNGMPFTMLTNATERQKQYINAINFYLKTTKCKIIFCENSNTDIHSFFENKQEKLEIITFPGNKDKQRGKGFGEAEIINHALCHSSFIQKDSIIIKITGRLIVNNINHIINSLKCERDFVTCSLHSDLKFADSRIFCATQSFYIAFLKMKDHIDDSKGVFFEHVLASTVLNSSMRFIPFSEEPLFIGISGTTGESYQKSTTHDGKGILYQRYYWELIKKVNNCSFHRHPGLYEKFATELHILLYKLLSTFI